MENVKHRKSMKPKNRFTLCCFCVGSSKSDVEVNVPYERHEAYDYVVEKLAIKRVPISLFATEEDLAEIENASLSTLTTNTTDYKTTLKDKRSAAVFSNYYSMIQKTNFPIDSHKRHIKLRSGTARIQHTDKRRHGPMSKNIPLDLITKVKKPSAVPKELKDDAQKPPDKDNIPTKVKAQVHEHLELKNSIRMTPQLQETLNALGSRKRPDGSPSINHRTINRLAINDSNNDNKTVLQLKKDIPINPDQGVDKINLTDSSGTPQDDSHERVEVCENNLQENTKTANVDDNEELNPLEAGSSKGQSQKWKIIIKEHDDSSKSSEVDSTDYTTDSELD